jgi:hypothetical protein
MDFIPFKIYIEKALLEDPLMIEDLGNYIGLEFVIPLDGNVVIVSKNGLIQEDQKVISENMEMFMATIAETDEEYVN